MLKLKSKSKLKAKPRVQANFYDLVGQAQQKALQPYIGDQVKNIGQAIYLEFAKTLATYKNRLRVLENVLINSNLTTESGLESLYFDEEDKVDGYTTSTDPVKEGDSVRVKVRNITNKEEEFRKLGTRSVAVAPFDIHPDLEKELVGMVAGQTKIITVKEADKEYQIETTLVRVAVKNEAEKEETSEASSNENAETESGS